MPLLQNNTPQLSSSMRFDYQSECHCSKTPRIRHRLRLQFDYQSECHCSKTRGGGCDAVVGFDYQSECHCSKTCPIHFRKRWMFDYQSECHCPKTHSRIVCACFLFDYQSECHCSKTVRRVVPSRLRLITSQNATAPKPLKQNSPCKGNGHPTGKALYSSRKCWSITNLSSIS